MIDEQPRTDANSRDRSPDHQYFLSIEQTAELYAQAGHPRTIRAIQKYCALSKLDCHKVDIHDRTPVILESKDFEEWECGDVKGAVTLMKPAGEDVLQKWPVSKRVNTSRADGADATLIEPVEIAA